MWVGRGWLIQGLCGRGLGVRAESLVIAISVDYGGGCVSPDLLDIFSGARKLVRR
jgi:hypothetical protein